MFRLFEGNFGSAFGNLANGPPASSNGAQNGLFGVNGGVGGAQNSNNKVQNAVVATLHGTSKNEYGTNTIGYGYVSLIKTNTHKVYAAYSRSKLKTSSFSLKLKQNCLS